MVIHVMTKQCTNSSRRLPCLFVRKSYYINTDLSPRGQGFDFAEFLAPDAPALMSSVMPMRLSQRHAKNLQLEMQHLLEKYMILGGSQDYVLHIGLTPGQMQTD